MRLLRPASAKLSDCVPGQMCRGLTQRVLSHAWQAFMPRGNETPFAISQLMRCALAHRPRRWNCPYRPSVAPRHGQHSSGPRLSTFAQNRACQSGQPAGSAVMAFVPPPRADHAELGAEERAYRSDHSQLPGHHCPRDGECEQQCASHDCQQPAGRFVLTHGRPPRRARRGRANSDRVDQTPGRAGAVHRPAGSRRMSAPPATSPPRPARRRAHL